MLTNDAEGRLFDTEYYYVLSDIARGNGEW